MPKKHHPRLIEGVSLCAGGDTAQYSVLTCYFPPERAVKSPVQRGNQCVLRDKQRYTNGHFNSYFPSL